MKFTAGKTAKGSLARLGTLETPHGMVQTPVFMPVGTAGIVKTLAPWEMEELGAEIILGNTYHLHVRPGEKLIEELGGLHKWSSWSKPILTDSGGYQAFSLGKTRAKMAKTSDTGVRFFSHIDGAKLEFTPESVIDIQRSLGSDIVMVLDDCAPHSATDKRLFQAVKRTGEWAKKSSDYWSGLPNTGAGLFGIVQGGANVELRQQSLRDIQALPFDGIAVGGVSVGEGKAAMTAAVDAIAADLDTNRPHYLMGVGEPDDLVRMIHRGIDMFDCVLATRLARHGAFWLTDFSRLDLRNSAMKYDAQPLDPNCSCRICQQFSRSYLRHLFVSGETFAGRALSYHNLFFLLGLVAQIRSAIADDTFTTKFAPWLNVSPASD